MTDDVWQAVARAAAASQSSVAEPRVEEPTACPVPGCTNGALSRTESGVVKLHYPTAVATRPCVASWKVLCRKCGLPVFDGKHVLSGAKEC